MTSVGEVMFLLGGADEKCWSGYGGNWEGEKRLLWSFEARGLGVEDISRCEAMVCVGKVYII